VLKISLLFYSALFLILCVASTVLWNVARDAGTVEQIENFITESGGFGNCEAVEQTEAGGATTTTVAGQAPTSSTTTAASASAEPDFDADEGDECPAGQELAGEFRFKDDRIFQATLLGGLVLVIAGTAFTVILAMLFNLISDLTGGVRMTLLEEETAAQTGSPRRAARG
jgi:Transmembrane domain of unknown function (DUF3566)